MHSLSQQIVSASNITSIQQLLASQNHDRWVLLIAPPQSLQAETIKRLGGDIERVLVLHSKQVDDIEMTVKRAIRSEQYQSVLCWDTVGSGAAVRIEQEAAIYDCRLGLLASMPTIQCH